MKREIQIIVVAMTIYAINRITKTYNNIPVIGYLCKCHINDCIGGIVFSAYVNIVLGLWKYPPITKLFHICVMMLCCGVVWEYVCPLFLDYSVSDFWDILSYVLGGVLYYCFKKGIKKQRTTKENLWENTY